MEELKIHKNVWQQKTTAATVAQTKYNRKVFVK
jgi:hypothetical protein